jgi:hypothetical protein
MGLANCSLLHNASDSGIVAWCVRSHK